MESSSRYSVTEDSHKEDDSDSSESNSPEKNDQHFKSEKNKKVEKHSDDDNDSNSSSENDNDEKSSHNSSKKQDKDKDESVSEPEAKEEESSAEQKPPQKDTKSDNTPEPAAKEEESSSEQKQSKKDTKSEPEAKEEESSSEQKQSKKDTKSEPEAKEEESSSEKKQPKKGTKSENPPEQQAKEDKSSKKDRKSDKSKSKSKDKKSTDKAPTQAPPPTNESNTKPDEAPKSAPSTADQQQAETATKKTDRYGWVTENVELSAREKKLIQIETAKEDERTKKWLDMTKDFKAFMKKNRNKVASRIKKGVPDRVRGRVWACLAQADDMKKKYPTKMSELLQKPPLPGYNTIDKDLPRTFPQIKRFSDTNTLESLKRILYCYCQTDTVLGYTQGMSFIAGILLNYMDEETAYYCFLNVMLGDRLNQRGYLLSGFPRLEHANVMLMCLMQKYCPKVLKHMDELNVMMSMFTPGWFLTVFQSYNWQPEFQLRIFERYLFYGTRALLNLGLVIILYHQKELEKADMEKFLNILQHPDTSPKMLNWHSVLDDWDKKWITKAEYDKLLNRCHVQKETSSY